MKSFLAAMFAVSLLVAAPAANAETTESIDTVSVVGIGRVPISQTANPVEADTQYHLALVQAIGDGLAKAQMLAAAGHAHVGPLEAISEGGTREAHEVRCKNAENERSGSYKGAEPDAGTALPPLIAVRPAAPPRPVVVTVTRKKKGKGKGKSHGRIHTKRHGPVARKAETPATPVTCEISAELSLVYDLEVSG